MLLPLALLPWWPHLRRRPAALVHSDGSLAAEAARASLASRLRWILPLVRSAVLALLVVALARPVKTDEETRIRTEGIAIMLVVDRSSSMLAMDFTIGGVRVDRLAALKAVVRDFVRGGDGLPGRPNDLIGAVSFARFADGIAPLTLDHDHVLAALAQVSVANRREEDGTAIGDAVALGVERLRDVAVRSDGEEDGRSTTTVKSRVLILLTDGENNAGDIDPRAAAELARTFGVRIHTIGVGTRGEAPFPFQDPFGNRVVRLVPVTIDEDLLRAMAETTGGQYFRATDSASLRAIYEAIDALEKTETERSSFVRYAELAVRPLRLGGWLVPPLVAAALVALLLEQTLAATRFRTLV
jgi:Ca-activated chloride channel family protein